MEKPSAATSKGKNILRFLPKAASFSFPNPAYNSPGRDRTRFHRNFSGPILPMIPAEARRKPGAGGFETAEPTSPRVTCVGQVKRRKIACGSGRSSSLDGKEWKAWFGIFRMFRRAAGRAGDGALAAEEERPAAGAPPLGQLRRFASGRQGVGGFDRRAQRVADERAEEGTDEELEGEHGEEEEASAPHSAPAVEGGGVELEPRKEVNLGKMRTVAPPSSLQLE